jgi:hypothetical protein
VKNFTNKMKKVVCEETERIKKMLEDAKVKSLENFVVESFKASFERLGCLNVIPSIESYVGLQSEHVKSCL